MNYSIDTFYKEKMQFDVKVDDHIVSFDTSKENGGENSGPSPKKTMLGTLAACSGVDVVGILKKMRVDFSDFSINTEADLSEEHPKVFTHIRMDYRIKVDKSAEEKVVKAVKLSQDKYCGISAMLKKNCPIDYKITYLG